jgi:hypothetical protein
MIRDYLLKVLGVLDALLVLGLKGYYHLVLLVILIPFMLMNEVHVLHVDPAVVHPPQTSLELEKVLTLPDRDGMSITILDCLLNLF